MPLQKLMHLLWQRRQSKLSMLTVQHSSVHRRLCVNDDSAHAFPIYFPLYSIVRLTAEVHSIRFSGSVLSLLF